MNHKVSFSVKEKYLALMFFNKHQQETTIF